MAKKAWQQQFEKESIVVLGREDVLCQWKWIDGGNQVIATR